MYTYGHPSLALLQFASCGRNGSVLQPLTNFGSRVIQATAKIVNTMINIISANLQTRKPGNVTYVRQDK